jgi:hypothetical protein
MGKKVKLSEQGTVLALNTTVVKAAAQGKNHCHHQGRSEALPCHVGITSCPPTFSGTEHLHTLQVCKLQAINPLQIH